MLVSNTSKLHPDGLCDCHVMFGTHTVCLCQVFPGRKALHRQQLFWMNTYFATAYVKEKTDECVNLH